METCINYCEADGWAYVSSDERRWINRVRCLAAGHPEQCRILRQPEENQGFVYARIPQGWVKISPPKAVHLTDEQRAARAEALLKARRNKG